MGMTNVQRSLVQVMAGVSGSLTGQTSEAGPHRDSSGHEWQPELAPPAGECVSSLQQHLESQGDAGVFNASICAVPEDHLLGFLRASSAKPKVPYVTSPELSSSEEAPQLSLSHTVCKGTVGWWKLNPGQTNNGWKHFSQLQSLLLKW